MTPDVTLPGADVADVVTICADPSPIDGVNRWTVHDGVAPPNIEPPFVSVFALGPQNDTQGLAAEDWGKLDAVYQVSCFGESTAQAVWLAGQILDLDAWGPRWTLELPMPDPIADSEPQPTWVFQPLTFRHHNPNT